MLAVREAQAVLERHTPRAVVAAMTLLVSMVVLAAAALAVQQQRERPASMLYLQFLTAAQPMLGAPEPGLPEKELQQLLAVSAAPELNGLPPGTLAVKPVLAAAAALVKRVLTQLLLRVAAVYMAAAAPAAVIAALAGTVAPKPLPAQAPTASSSLLGRHRPPPM
jgi:hypothetical protein